MLSAALALSSFLASQDTDRADQSLCLLLSLCVSGRIDDLEKSIGELMAQAGIEEEADKAAAAAAAKNGGAAPAAE